MLKYSYCRRRTEKTSVGSDRSVRQSRRIKRMLLLLWVVILALLFMGNLRYRDNIAETLRYQGQIAASRVLADQTMKVLNTMELGYDDLVRVARDETGKITSVETNMTRLNQIKSRLEQEVTAAINEQGISDVRVPLGTLLGSEYLTGQGPMISIRFQPMGSLQTTFESRFQSAGINQTSHRIALNLTVQLTTLIPMHRATTVVNTNFILADTVIVGEVPDYYTGITGGLLPGGSTAILDPLDVELKREN